MIRSILAALIGNRIDRRDGRGGVKGALAGVAVDRVARRGGRFGWLLLGILSVWRLFFRRRTRTRSW